MTLETEPGPNHPANQHANNTEMNDIYADTGPASLFTKYGIAAVGLFNFRVAKFAGYKDLIAFFQ